MSTLLEDITSADPIRIWSSAGAIIRLRDGDQLDQLAAHLPYIRATTDDVPLGGMMLPNSVHLQFALRKLEFHWRREGCLCRLYPEYLMYNPEWEAEDGHVRIDGTTYIQNKWVDEYACTCTACGARYLAKEGESHYMWWKWSLVS
jgi:hypothetical protein